VRNVPWQAPPGMSLPDERIRALLAARDGTLWIGTGGGLASWKGYKLLTYPRLDGAEINGLVEDREGTVWVATRKLGSTIGLVCAIRRGDTECYGEDGTLGPWIGSVYEDSNSILWVSAATGVWRWKPGPPKFYALPDGVVGSLQPLSESATGALLVATRNGIWQIIETKPEPISILSLSRTMRPLVVLSDREGGIWSGTFEEGLLHIHGGRVDSFTHVDGLSGDTIATLYEDREGNVWVSTLDGIDRFRAPSAVTYSVEQGVVRLVDSVAVDTGGGIWISTSRGLYRRHGAHVEQILAKGLPSGEASLFEDSKHRMWLGSRFGLGYLEAGRFIRVRGVPDGYVDAIGEDDGRNLWIAHRNAGLLRVSPDLGVQAIPWTKIGKTGSATRLAVDQVHGGLWLGFLAGGIVHFVDGNVRASYSVRDGLGKGIVNDLRISADGTVWVATDGGLSRVKDGRIGTLDRKRGLRSGRFHHRG
jgi:ligand-binding sensor domain-containing protein